MFKQSQNQKHQDCYENNEMRYPRVPYVIFTY